MRSISSPRHGKITLLTAALACAFLTGPLAAEEGESYGKIVVQKEREPRYRLTGNLTAIHSGTLDGKPGSGISVVALSDEYQGRAPTLNYRWKFRLQVDLKTSTTGFLAKLSTHGAEVFAGAKVRVRSEEVDLATIQPREAGGLPISQKRLNYTVEVTYGYPGIDGKDDADLVYSGHVDIRSDGKIIFDNGNIPVAGKDGR